MNELSDLLPRAFGPFLGRFAKPSEVQLRAIPRILAGADVLVSAPTASGKTEAFAAPAAEIALAACRGRPAVLILSPTRALANDLFRRLETRFEDVLVAFGRYTGEHKDRASDGGLPEVVIATPEALDSLLARRPAQLAELRLVVMDEIHLLDNTARGDHLRVLLHRLEKATRVVPQRLAVSATIDDPAGLSARYLRQAEIITVSGARPIRVKEFAGEAPLHVVAHLDELAAGGFRKILVFCNRRRDVEILTRAVRKASRFREAVFPHHGSLSKATRERTESGFLAAPAGVAIATMTLEIGIDIGSVDYVLLVGLPTGVSGLLQRIGRGNRRTGVTRAGFTVAHDGTRIVAETMFRAARDGRLLGRPYGLRPGVIVQQALVMAAAKGWIDAPTLRAAVPDSMWTEAGLEDAEDLLEHLVEKECLERSNGRRYVVAEEIERRFEAGTLHSNLADEPGVDVVDRLSGEIVGRIDEPDSREIHLGGGTRRVVARQGTRVLTDGATEDVEPRFASRGIPLTSHALATEVVRGFPVSDLAAGQWPTFADQGSLFVFHGLGTLGAYFLRRLVENLRGQSVVVSSSAFGIRLLLPSFEIPSPEEGVLLRLLAEEEHRFTALCAAGPWHDTLPRHVRLHALRRLSGLDSIAKVLASSRLRPVDVAAAVRAAYAKLVG